MMMWDSTSPVPARFIAMMKDYASSFAGKSATTADFRAPSPGGPRTSPCRSWCTREGAQQRRSYRNNARIDRVAEDTSKNILCAIHCTAPIAPQPRWLDSRREIWRHTEDCVRAVFEGRLLTSSLCSIHFSITFRLAPADRKLAEADPELDARPLAGQRQRNLTFDQGLRL
jgi:hypothetical protein